MSTRTALVTGAAGFVGRHITAALVAAGYTVTAVDIDPDVMQLREARVYLVDALEAFHGHGDRYDLVVHCAAVVGGRTMIDGKPAELAAVDLELDAALWRHALDTRPGRVVYLSSSAAYPVAFQRSPASLREEWLDPRNEHGVHMEPDNTYGLVKFVGERMAAEVRDAGVPVTVVRPFSGYGDDQALDYPFPSFVRRALNGDGTPDQPFEVWGTGRQVRDFIHIDDIVAAIVRLVELEVDGPVNLGTGRATSFNDLAAMVWRAVGNAVDPVLEHHLDAPVGVHWRVADTTLLRQFYEPVVTLEDGIERAIAALASRSTP